MARHIGIEGGEGPQEGSDPADAAVEDHLLADPIAHTLAHSTPDLRADDFSYRSPDSKALSSTERNANSCSFLPPDWYDSCISIFLCIHTHTHTHIYT